MRNSGLKLAGSKILVVDDKKENLELITRILEAEGYEVAFALSGEKALHIATLYLPELILLDVMMPGIDGFETCRRMKALSDLKDIPVIFVTAKTHISDIVEAFHSGAVDYVTKPIRQEELLARVSTHLQLRQLLVLRDDLIDQLREHNLELAELNKLREAQLEESERLSHLGELVGELTHELGTPLGVTNTAISSMRDHLLDIETAFNAQSLSKEQLLEFIHYGKECTKLSGSSMHYANQLIASFKDIVVGEFNEAVVELQLHHYLNDIKHLLMPKVKRTPHHIDIKCEPELAITTQAGSLSQVIINLVNNALLHAFANDSHGSITVSATQQQDCVMICIQDNGQGIDAELLPKVFDKYFTTRLGSGGSGLGLFIVRKLVEDKLAGSITLHSEKNQGSCFTLTLPLKPPSH
ncbi:response regulator [Pseudoalteromonas fenneropenaei]|uniref:histidine kinase n=1 Tax=Pseudoalteromonas fenneropenaei TaxID=1737459 RepID=A0ABV7CJ64_9GAMM